MEDIIKFRIFLTFPLLGLLIPDLGLFLTGSSALAALPVTHRIIASTLLICIAVLTVGISLYKKKHNIGKTATPVFDL
ncbi:hypothetical protein LJ707_12615 [Mucilaginibacter sp. UR6-1]|uniref:hypothetical protein n=1 Tax=Mucilaginibacter sp. UR6-1 TaxID=1435643 RepID=UPI001E628BF6|nr:hypothetical protein [Mucilaginibacter sp. UR6-1]MCC8409774.1 hypothetical protein [Mucilaginibacter sp. UR6-1]